jgi:hypothetical protein
MKKKSNLTSSLHTHIFSHLLIESTDAEPMVTEGHLLPGVLVGVLGSAFLQGKISSKI